MNQEQRAALRKLAEEATPGPWYCKHKNEAWSSIVIDEGSDCGFIDAWSSPVIEGVQCSAEKLSDYIAAANPSTILQLLDYIETLEKDAARYRWQPIETAPKDGRTILIGKRNLLGNWRTIRGRYFSKEVIASDWENGEDCDEGWYETSVECDADINCWWIGGATHWMPLPAAAMKGETE